MGAIAGIVVGCVVAIALVSVVLWMLLCRKNHEDEGELFATLENYPSYLILSSFVHFNFLS